MRRVWFVLLALSLGLNAGLIYRAISLRSDRAARSRWADAHAERGFGPGHAADVPPAPGFPCPIPDCEGLGPRRVAGMARWLGLDDRQRAATEAVLSEMMPLILAQRDAVREARRRAADEYRQIQLDPERVQASVRHLNVAQARLDSLVAETMFREASLLTPEQRTRYFAAMPWERRLAGGGPHAGPRRP